MGYQDNSDRGWNRIRTGLNKAVDNHHQQHAAYSTPTPARSRTGLAACAVYLLVYFGVAALLCNRSYQLTNQLWDSYTFLWMLGGWFITAWVVAMIAWFVDSVVTMVKHVTP